MRACVDVIEEAGSGELTLCWVDRGSARRGLPHSEVAQIEARLAAVHAAEAAVQGPVAGAQQHYGAALLSLLDGPERLLERSLMAASNEDVPLSLVVRLRVSGEVPLARHRAALWRWELLAAARAGLERKLQLVVQLGDRDPGPPRRLEDGGLRVLFLAYSPEGVLPVLDHEVEEERIHLALERAIRDGRARVRTTELGTVEELRQELAARPYHVVHLTGHGVLTQDGPRLVMEDDEGRRRDVSARELLDAFERACSRPELVMISSCHSAGSQAGLPSMAAQLVAGGVRAVVGWSRPVRDDLATQAATDVYEQLCAGKTPAEALALARQRLREVDEQAIIKTHAWSTLSLLTRESGGFRLERSLPPLSDAFDTKVTYNWLGTQGGMRVMATGFVGRRRPLQELVHLLRRGEHHGERKAGATVLGLRGVGKSCLIGRTLDRYRQDFGDPARELGLVVLHGRIDEAAVHAQMSTQARRWQDDKALATLSDATRPLCERLRWLFEGDWSRRPLVIVLDDFEQNLQAADAGDARIVPDVVELLEVLVPACWSGRPKLLVTTSMSFALPANCAGALVELRLGPFEPATLRKLWSRGQQSGELKQLSPEAWQELAERLGRNARVLDWARSLLGGKTPDEVKALIGKATLELTWTKAEPPSAEEQDQLARVFLCHIAYEEALGRISEDARRFIERARVYDRAVPARALTGLAEGLSLELDTALPALQNLGLLEAGVLGDGAAYRVSPLVAATLDTDDPKRCHRTAAAFWESVAEHHGFEAFELAWRHALLAEDQVHADRLGRVVDAALYRAGLYRRSLELAEEHSKRLPRSSFGLRWTGDLLRLTGRSLREAREKVEQALAIEIELHRTDLHLGSAVSLHALACILQAQGDLKGARQKLERCLAILAELRGDEVHPDVAASLHTLAGVLQAQGDLKGAREKLEHSLAIQHELRGTDVHPGVAASFHALASVLEDQGDLIGARKCLERSLAIKAELYGTDVHPDVAASLHALASVLHAEGDLSGARERLERSLAILGEIYGTDVHPGAAACLHLLAWVLKGQGDLKGAREKLDHSLVIQAELHGTDVHPGIAASFQVLGSVLRALGDLKGARERLERSLDIQAELYGTDNHPGVAASLHGLAEVLQAQGDLKGAREKLERSLAIQTELHGTELHPDVAASLHALAGVLQEEGDLDGAREKLERSLAIRAAVHRTDAHPEVAASLHALAGVFKARGDLKGAREKLERSLAIKAELHGTDMHPDVAASLHALAGVLQAQGDLKRAREKLERSLAIKAELHGSEVHPEVAASLHELAGVLQDQGDLGGAREKLERSVTIQAELHGTDVHPGVAASLHALARVLHAQGDLTGAREKVERSLAIQAALHGTDVHPSVAASLHVVAVVLQAQGDLRGAREKLERSLAIKAELHGTDIHPEVAASLHALAGVLAAQGDFEGARENLERSLAIQSELYGSNVHPSVAASLYALAGILQVQGDLMGARESLERSLAIQTELYGSDVHSGVAASLHALAIILQAQGDLTGARESLKRSVAIKAELYGTYIHPGVAASLHALAGVLRCQGDLKGARERYERLLAIAAQLHGTEFHPDVAATLNGLAGVFADEGNLEVAAQTFLRSLEICDQCFGTRDHYLSAETEVSLALTLLGRERQAEAVQLVEHALPVLHAVNPDHPYIQMFHRK
jgi:tetratricopeptide (TPR) repeat protein